MVLSNWLLLLIVLYIMGTGMVYRYYRQAKEDGMVNGDILAMFILWLMAPVIILSGLGMIIVEQIRKSNGP